MNRYGRHGTRAWLRRYLRLREQQQQQQQETSTALVAAKPFIPVVVFNITVPAGVGKVIIIVTDKQGEHIQTNETGVNGHSNQLPEADIVDDEKTKGSQLIEDRAKTLANIALKSIKVRYGSSPVYLQEKGIDDYASFIVEKEMRHIDFPKDRAYYIRELESVFVRSFKQSLRDDRDYQCNFQTEDDWQMSEVVRKDKGKHHIHITDPCHYHDPGIVHAIEERGISLEEAYTNVEYFEWIEQWSNKYANFYSDPRKEVQQVDLTIFLERD